MLKHTHICCVTICDWG